MESCGACPEKWCGGSCFAEGRVAGRCFTSAVPAIGGRSTAGMSAAAGGGANRGGVPTGGTSKAGKDGSITATASEPTGNVAASGA